MKKLILSLTIGLVFSGCMEPRTKTDKRPDKPLSLELLGIEQTVGKATDDDYKLAETVLNEMLAILNNHSRPETAEQAISITEKLAVIMARKNFIQPQLERNWPDTLGVAFRPIQLSEESLERLLSSSGNRVRAEYIDKSQPIHYVDCDMGAQLLITAIQQAGWDARLVTVPKHAFIRWHLPDGTLVNWDWTNWSSNPDSYYLSEYGLDNDLKNRGVYLASLDRRTAFAHFLGLLAIEATDHKEALKLGEQAVRDDPHSPLTLNNFAWDLAIDPEGDHESRKRAVYYGLLGWTSDIGNGNRADTAACAFAAKGEKDLALAIADYAISKAYSQSSRASYTDSKNKILQGELCE